MFNVRMCGVRPAVACVAVLTLAHVPAEANLIVNGSFETPAVPNGGYINYPGGATAITGWTVVGVDSSVISSTFTQSGITFEAQNGAQWLDLAGITSNSASSGVTTTVATSIGGVYAISFYVGSATDNNLFYASTVDLSIDGGPRVGYTNPTTPHNMLDWKLFTVQFTATSTTTRLTFLNGSASFNYVCALDNVSVEAVVCQCPGDMNGDGFKDGSDIQQFLNCLSSAGNCACAEMDGAPGLTQTDITAFVVALLNAATCA